jgi:hypothetical protein
MKLPKITVVEADVLFQIVGQHFIGQGDVRHTVLFNLFKHSEDKLNKAVLGLEKKGLIKMYLNEKQESVVSLCGEVEHDIIKQFFGYPN